MKYDKILTARFISRPNRFTAHIELDGEIQICHVKNTGRLQELLLPGAEVFVQKAANPDRKTAYDLIAVKHGSGLVNIDSNAPNKVFGEYLKAGGLGFIPDYIRAETKHGDSRFDYYFEHDGIKCFTEVKGVTLRKDGIALFPDAPSERGVKHLRGLIDCVSEGYEACAVFIIKIDGIHHFEANRDSHPEFAAALKDAASAGVKILALGCDIERDSIQITKEIPVVI